MGTVTYIETEAKSVLNRVRSQAMPFDWSFNPYRGCRHRCKYCYARATHTYFDLNGRDDFENQIFVKVNAPDILARQLGARCWNRELVAVGTATDAYQPAEGRYRLTRRSLECFARYRTPVSLITKSTMIYRDRDVLQQLAEAAGVTVFFSVITLRDELVRKVEPGTPPPRKRLKVLESLVRAGVSAGVMVAPILPGLTDDEANLAEVVRAARDHGAAFVSGGVLRMCEGALPSYVPFLETEFPGLLPHYRRLYPATYARRDYKEKVVARLSHVRDRYRMRPAPPVRTRGVPDGGGAGTGVGRVPAGDGGGPAEGAGRAAAGPEQLALPFG